jgi:hypothetical protein
VYARREVELVLLVKHLLYVEKYTVDGARQKLDEHRRGGALRGATRQALARDVAESSSATCATCWTCSRGAGRHGRAPTRPRRGELDSPARRPGPAPSVTTIPSACGSSARTDDGYPRPGAETLTEAAERPARSTSSPLDREQSATSHSLTLHHPVRPVRRDEAGGRWTARPTDCVSSPSRRSCGASRTSCSAA